MGGHEAQRGEGAGDELAGRRPAWLVMVSTLVFLTFRRVLGLLGMDRWPDEKDVEIAVLRHQLAVLRRQVARPWYATTGHDPADITEHRTRAPWYTTKANPSTADMISKLRRVLIATKYQVTRPEQPTPTEIHAIRLAWDTHAA